MIEESLTKHLSKLTEDMNNKVAKVSETCDSRNSTTNEKINELASMVDSLRTQITNVK